MAISKNCFLLLWVMVASSSLYGYGGLVFARPINPSISHFGKYSKVFETLGVECKCCNEVGECTSSWTGSCSKLHCKPWKFH